MTDDRSGRLTDLGIRLVGGTAAGVGVLGFVTLVGGAVAEAQLSGAGLPASRAVADLPRADLLVIGARLLTPFVGVLVMAFLAVGWIESRGEWRAHVGARVGTAVVLSVVGLGLTWWAADAEAAQVWVWAVCGAAAAVALVVIWAIRRLSFATFVIAGGVVATLAAVSSGYALAYAQPQVRPVAVLDRDGRVIVGIYAAANSDEVAVGQVCTAGAGGGPANRGDASVGAIVVVPRHDVVAMAIGTNGSLPTAMLRERALLAAISPSAVLHLPVGGPPYQPPGVTGRICSDAGAAMLRGSGPRGVVFLGP